MNIETYKPSESFPFEHYSIENICFDTFGLYDFGDDRTQIFYGGKYFIFSLDSFLYFHTMHEGIGQYELLKRIVPDLKIVPVAWMENFDSRKKDLAVMLDMLKPYGITDKDIVFLSREKATFEKIFYYTTRVNPLLIQAKVPQDGQAMLNNHSLQYVPQGKEIYQPDKFYMDGFNLIKELYKKYLVKNNDLPKKIYFSRMKQDNRIRKIYELMVNDGNLNNEDLIYLKQEESNMGGQRYLLQLIKERYMLLEEEIRLEKYFKSKGYEIIDPENLSFYEQINYYYNATHIAAIRGSGLFNTIFCQPNANIFILDTAQSYEFAYLEICKLGTNNVYEIPFTLRFKKFMQDNLFSVDNILGILNSHYSEVV